MSFNPHLQNQERRKQPRSSFPTLSIKRKQFINKVLIFTFPSVLHTGFWQPCLSKGFFWGMQCLLRLLDVGFTYKIVLCNLALNPFPISLDKMRRERLGELTHYLRKRKLMLSHETLPSNELHHQSSMSTR